MLLSGLFAAHAALTLWRSRQCEQRPAADNGHAEIELIGVAPWHDPKTGREVIHKGDVVSHPPAAMFSKEPEASGAELRRRRIGSRFDWALSALIVCYVVVAGSALALDFLGFGIRRPFGYLAGSFAIGLFIAFSVMRFSPWPPALWSVVLLVSFTSLTAYIIILERWHAPSVMHGLSNVNLVQSWMTDENGDDISPAGLGAIDPQHWVVWSANEQDTMALIVIEVSNLVLRPGDTFHTRLPPGAHLTEHRGSWEGGRKEPVYPAATRDSGSEEWAAADVRIDSDGIVALSLDAGANESVRIDFRFRALYEPVVRMAGPGRKRHSLWWHPEAAAPGSFLEFADNYAVAIEDLYPSGRINARRAAVWLFDRPDRFQVVSVSPLGLYSDVHKYIGFLAASVLGAELLRTRSARRPPDDAYSEVDEVD